MLAMFIIPEAYIRVFNSEIYLDIQGVFFFSCFQILFNILSLAVSPILIGQSRIHIMIFLHAIRAMIFLLLSFIFLPVVENKLYGILTIISISYIVNIISTIYIAQNTSKVHFLKYLKKIFLITVLFLTICILIMFPFHIKLIFLWKIPLFLGVVIIFHIVIITVGTITKQDIEIIKNIIRSFFTTDKDTKWKKWIK